MVSRMDEIILQEIRDHRKESAERHELMEERVRSLEETRAHQKGAAIATTTIATTVSGLFAILISWFKP